MDTIQEFIRLVQCLVIAGATMRGLYICVVMPTDPDNKASYKIRLRNLLVFTVLAMCIGGVVRIIAGYF